MENLTEKTLKRFLKRKVKLTESLVVIFLITGSIIYADDISGVVVIDDAKVGEQVVVANGTEITITENGSIQSDTNGIDTGSYSNIKIQNNGSIKAKATVEGVGIQIVGDVSGNERGNGIYRNTSSSEASSIENNGNIEGNITVASEDSSVESYYSGNGVMGDITTNSETISGSAILTGGVSSDGDTSVESKYNGNGIIGSVEKNSGAISGNTTLTGGISNDDAYAESEYSGNGVIGSVESSSGIISGNAILTGGTGTDNFESENEYSGNGVMGSVKNNSGTISGSTSLTGGEMDVNTNYYNLMDASAESDNGGNGIKNISSLSVQNTGIISGTAVLKAGKIKFEDSSIYGEDATAYAKSTYSGNGVLGNEGLESVESNSGVISGEVYVTGGTVTVYGIGDAEAYAKSYESGNGVNSDIGSNRGVITGNAVVTAGSVTADNSTAIAYANSRYSGNGVNGDIEENLGTINGSLILTGGTATSSIVTEAHAESTYSGNGVNGDVEENFGTIKGNFSSVNGKISVDSGTTYTEDINGSISDSGYGVAGDNTSGNAGVIMGSHGSVSGDVGENYGLLVGLDQGSGSSAGDLDVDRNYGMDVIIDEDGIVQSIQQGEDIDDVINLTKSMTFVQEDLNTMGTIENSSGMKVINGLGIETGVVTTGEDLNISNSMINAYHTAMTIQDGHTVYADQVIFNGGGFGSLDDSPVISGDAGDNTLYLTGGSMVNGDIFLDDGEDYLSVERGVILNGDVDGGEGEDTVILGAAATTTSMPPMEGVTKVFGSISSAEKIGVEGDVVLYETASIEGKGQIDIRNDGELYVKVDGSQKDDEGNLSGHGLYYFDGIVESSDETGTLTFKPMGIGREDIIGFESGQLLYTEGLTIDLDSVLYEIDDDNNQLLIKVKKTFPSLPSELQKSYSSLVTSGDNNIDAFVFLTDDTKAGVYSALSQIYRNTPATQTPYVSKLTLGIFNDSVIANAGMVQEGDWKVFGSAVGGRSEKDESIAVGDVKSDTNIYGGYGLAEYGIAKDYALGFVVGGANTNTNIDGGSEVDGDSLYLSSYMKTRQEDYSIIVGASYLYTSYDSVRKLNSLEFDDSYSSNAFSLYTEGRYFYEIQHGLSIQPNLRLNYSYVDQDSVDEGNDALAIRVDSESFNYFDTRIGVDLVKEFISEAATLELTAGLGYNFVTGDDDNSTMDARFTSGGNKFNVYVPGADDTFEVNLRAEAQMITGIYYTVGGIYKTGDDTDEYIGEIGIGYRF